jgi:hypothetical protein
MITTSQESGDEDDIIMESTDGEVIPLQIGETSNFLKGEISSPLDWKKRIRTHTG